MNVNRSAEYTALWKSRKRAEWEAVRLGRQASALSQPAGSGVATAHRHPDAEGTGGPGNAADENGRHPLASAGQLQQESQRMWQLCAELDAELDQVAAALTPGQRKSAEKMLKQWEKAEQERLEQGGKDGT